MLAFLLVLARSAYSRIEYSCIARHYHILIEYRATLVFSLKYFAIKLKDARASLVQELF